MLWSDVLRPSLDPVSDSLPSYTDSAREIGRTIASLGHRLSDARRDVCRCSHVLSIRTTTYGILALICMPCHTKGIMKKSDAIKHFGTQTALARALGIGKASVGQWDEIPLDRQCQIEILTAGALKADRHRLFPVDSSPPQQAA